MPDARHPTPRIDAVLVNWNGERWLPGVVETLRGQRGVELRCIIVDNASVDGSPAWLERHAGDMHVIRNPSNTGFAAACNQGIGEARAPYVLTVNPDIRLEPDYCARLAATLEAQDDVASATGKLVRAGDTEILDSTGHDVYRSGWAGNRDEGTRDPGTGLAGEVFGVCAAAALYRRAALLDVELFDGVFCERFFAYLEDVDLDWRLRWRGWRAAYVPEALGYHERSGTGARFSAPVRRHILKNYPLLLTRNVPAGWLAADLPRILLIGAALTLQHTVSSPSAIRGYGDFIRAVPDALRARRRIAAMRRSTPAELRRWLRPFPWRRKLRKGLRNLRTRRA